MGVRTETHAGRRSTVYSEVAGRVPGEHNDRLNPALREASRSPGRASSQAVTVRPNASKLPSRPNIVVLLLDDQDDFTPYWEAMPRTAAMMQNGLRFRNAFSPTPICSPGRCTFLSGRLAHNTGVYTLSGPHGPAPFGRETGTEFSVGLSQLGYINGHFGKTWGSDSPTSGWQRWCAVGSNNIYTGYGYQVFDYTNGVGSVYTSGEYITDFLANSAVNFLQKGVPSGQPFFICLAPTAPHLPLPPAPRDAAYAKHRWGDRLPIRPNYDERDVRDKSKWLREQAFVRSEAVPYARGEYHKRMGSLMAVNDMMARIQSVLTSQGKWNNTIVFVTSDNGYNLGSHRLIHKMAPYEESIHVPLYVAGPGVASGEITKMVGLHDLGPTFIQLAGGQAPSYMDGKPLGPFLTERLGLRRPRLAYGPAHRVRHRRGPSRLQPRRRDADRLGARHPHLSLRPHGDLQVHRLAGDRRGRSLRPGERSLRAEEPDAGRPHRRRPAAQPAHAQCAMLGGGCP